MAMLVVLLLGARAVAHALVVGTFDGLAPATEMLLEALIVGALLGLVTLLVIVMMAQRRPTQISVPNGVRRSAESLPQAARHLTLVPPPSMDYGIDDMERAAIRPGRSGNR